MVTQAVELQMRPLFQSKEERMSELGFKRINLLAGSRMDREG